VENDAETRRQLITASLRLRPLPRPKPPGITQPKRRGPRLGLTTQLLLQLIEQRNVQSQTEAARLLGVSRQRIHQIVKREGMDLHFEPPKPLARPICGTCGKLFSQRPSAPDTTCYTCLHKKVVVVCPTCGAERRVIPGYASRLKSALCGACSKKAVADGKRRPDGPRRRRGSLAQVTCPRCREERLVFAKEQRTKKTDLCENCSRLLTTGRRVRGLFTPLPSEFVATRFLAG